MIEASAEGAEKRVHGQHAFNEAIFIARMMQYYCSILILPTNYQLKDEKKPSKIIWRVCFFQNSLLVSCDHFKTIKPRIFKMAVRSHRHQQLPFIFAFADLDYSRPFSDRFMNLNLSRYFGALECITEMSRHVAE